MPNDANDPLFSIRGMRIVVAGAAGGLGSVLTRALHERGARLLLIDIDEAGMGLLSGELGGEIVTFTGDVTQEAQLREAVALAVERFGGIDAAINAAGVFTVSPSQTLDAADFRHCIDVNLTGAFLLSRVAADAMGENGGRIIHFASISSTVANPEYAAYASSKAGLAHLVRVLAREWAPRNITVNAIGPALTRTGLTQAHLDDPAFHEKAVGAIPMGRLGQPRDLLGAIILLLAPGGGFITGQTIYVDGGRTLV